MLHQITVTAVPDIPMIEAGDDLVVIILERLQRASFPLEDGDVVVIAHKVVSKAEGRITRLSDVQPSDAAQRLADATDKDPRLVQLILDDSSDILRSRPGLIIAEHRLGFVCANAGIDRSNVAPVDEDDLVARLPLDPDRSARMMRERIRELAGKTVAVIINDTHGRPFRNGGVGVAIGVAGLAPVTNLRGQPDLFGYTLRHTTVGLADQLASAASLLQGQADEGRPVIILRGVPYEPVEGSSREMLRSKDLDMFR